MSNHYYNELWRRTQQDCDILATADYEQQHQDVQGALSALTTANSAIEAKQLLQTTIYEFYIRYIQISNKLEDIYDKMVQPQKRLLLFKLLNACLGRVVELKHDLVNIDLMEFSYNDSVIERLKLTPPETELRIPRYFLRERHKEIEQRKRTLHGILVKLGWLEEGDSVEKPTEGEAIRLIQIHERARQGRLRAHFMKEIRLLKEKGKTEERENAAGGADSGVPLAAMRIQRMWRGHAARRKTRRRKWDEMVLIGMVAPPLQAQKQRAERAAKLEEIFEERYKLQETYREQFEAKMLTVREEIKEKHGPTMAEDMADEIRAWFKDTYDKTGKLPDFPSEDQGGSAHLFSRPG